MMKIKKKIATLILLLSAISFTADAYCQHSPADEYYNNNMNTQTPSEAHYNKNLRAGGDEWEEDDGPAGGGDGGNAGVGVPLGNAPYSLLFAGMAYCVFIIYRKQKRENTKLPIIENGILINKKIKK